MKSKCTLKYMTNITHKHVVVAELHGLCCIRRSELGLCGWQDTEPRNRTCAVPGSSTEG